MACRPRGGLAVRYATSVAVASSISGLLFGYEIGIADSLLKMESFSLYFGTAVRDAATGAVSDASDVDTVNGWIVSSFLFGCMLGALIVAFLADAAGRTRAILAGALVFVAGGAAQCAAPSLGALFAARFVSGVGVGILSEVAPLYLSEVSAASVRGRMIAVQQLMIVIGLLVASLVNAGLFAFAGGAGDAQWRAALGMQCAPGLLLLALGLRLPESPRWLVARDREATATKVLADLRGVPGHDAALQAELRGIRDAVDAEAAEAAAGGGGVRGALRALCHADVRPPLAAACLLQAFQQLTGINAVLYYAADATERMGVPRATASTAIVIGTSAVTVLATLPGLWLVEHAAVGRRALLLWGAAGMAAAHAAIAVFVLQLPPEAAGGGSDGSAADGVVSGFAVASMFVFLACFAATWGPVVWVVGAEVLPLNVRAQGTAAAAYVNWSANAAIGKAAPLMLRDIGGWTYAFFAACCVAMGAYAWAFVPETRGVALEDMPALWRRPRAPAPGSASAGGAPGAAAVELTTVSAKGAEAEADAEGERRPLRLQSARLPPPLPPGAGASAGGRGAAAGSGGGGVSAVGDTDTTSLLVQPGRPRPRGSLAAAPGGPENEPPTTAAAAARGDDANGEGTVGGLAGATGVSADSRVPLV